MPKTDPAGLEELRADTLAVIRGRGYQHRDEPFQLASGEFSHDYIDGKKALSAGRDLGVAGQAVVALTRDRGVEFDAVGGLTLGADPLAHMVAYLTGTSWFVVRKAAKDHGRGRRVEGAELGPGVRVLLVDDVVTTGGSSLQALDEVTVSGAEVVLALALVDRGETAAARFAERGVPYAALISYRDLDIPPVGVTGG